MANGQPTAAGMPEVGRSQSTVTASKAGRGLVLYLVTEDWYFMSHRLPMARAARDAGFDVAVAARMRAHRGAIEAEGFQAHDVGLSRGSLNPLRDALAIAAITRLYRRLKPGIVHHVALKPTLYGSIAARLAGVPRVVNAMAGLGFVFASRRPAARLVRPVVRALFRRLFDRTGSVLVLQNDDDIATFVQAGLASRERIVRIRGSGVDVDRFADVPPPPTDGPVTVAYVGRMIEDKGVETLIEAARLLRDRGRNVRLLLCGNPDSDNPGSISEATLREWDAEPGIEWRGHVDDIPALWAEAHVAVLASHREGLPMSLLEAAAAGRPLVATDVPGCREIARTGENALLFPVADAGALADAIEALADDPECRARFGAASRAIVCSDLSAQAVGQSVVRLYLNLVGGAQGERS